MVLTFADTHNMIAYLTKYDASEGFKHILDFLNGSVIHYALTIDPTIYVSCIKQFWSSVSIKKTNDVVRLQALINRQKVIITEDTVHQALHLDDAKSIDYLPNKEIIVELARMGTAWNEFSSFMALAMICFATAAQVGDLSSHTTKYTSYALTQKVFANMRRVGKGFSRVDTPLFEGMLVPQQAADDVANVAIDDVVAEDGRQGESQAQAYHIDLEHAKKVLSMQDDEPEPAELKEVIDVVTTAKLITEVVTAVAATITAAPSAAKRRNEVVIRDPEETATPSTIVHSEPKSKDKGKGILVQEPKPLKKQQQIGQDEAYARELEVKLNKN
nr:hypothetical protein [Tanacetum cinerariifolium]